jgi:hypothetical protein
MVHQSDRAVRFTSNVLPHDASQAHMERAPGYEHEDQPWIGAALSHLQAPAPAASLHPLPAPIVIYAQHRPRLSGPELLARYAGTVPARLVGRPKPSASRRWPRVMAGVPRAAWWAAVALGAITEAGGLPLV